MESKRQVHYQEVNSSQSQTGSLLRTRSRANVINPTSSQNHSTSRENEKARVIREHSSGPKHFKTIRVIMMPGSNSIILNNPYLDTKVYSTVKFGLKINYYTMEEQKMDAVLSFMKVNSQSYIYPLWNHGKNPKGGTVFRNDPKHYKDKLLCPFPDNRIHVSFAPPLYRQDTMWIIEFTISANVTQLKNQNNKITGKEILMIFLLLLYFAFAKS
jgi:hypothetical protein